MNGLFAAFCKVAGPSPCVYVQLVGRPPVNAEKSPLAINSVALDTGAKHVIAATAPARSEFFTVQICDALTIPDKQNVLNVVRRCDQNLTERSALC